jgi:plastocyanin
MLGSGCGGGDEGGGGGGVVAIGRTSTASGEAQTAQAGQSLAAPLRVIVTLDGAASSGRTVTWSTASGGQLTPATATTGADGIATTQWTLGGAVGAQGAEAMLSGATGSPVGFTSTATAPPTGLVVARTATASGNNQTAQVNTALPQPLRVIVTNNGTPQAGTAVTWSTATGSVNPAAATTGADGIATTVWTLGGSTGPQLAQAGVTGATGSPVLFAATGTSPPPASTISVANNSFSPATLTVTAGTAVRFLWNAGATQHNVTPASGNPSALPASPGLPALNNAPFEFTTTFAAPGVFRFYCDNHGFENSPTSVSGMAGTVTVN